MAADKAIIDIVAKVTPFKVRIFHWTWLLILAGQQNPARRLHNQRDQVELVGLIHINTQPCLAGN